MLTFAELPVFTIIFDCADKSGSNDVVSIRSGIAEHPRIRVVTRATAILISIKRQEVDPGDVVIPHMSVMAATPCSWVLTCNTNMNELSQRAH